MKIHTARKYLSGLPTAPDRAAAARFRTLYAAACEACSTVPVKSLSMIVAGRDSGYLSYVLMMALNHAGQRAAVIKYDIGTSPDVAVTIDEARVSEDEGAYIMTTVRKVIREQALVEHPWNATPTAYEVFLIATLISCARAGVFNIIVRTEASVLPAEFAALLPVAKAVTVTAAASDDSQLMASIIRRGVVEMVSAPQGGETLRTLSSLCAAVNCRYTATAKNEITSGAPNYKGIPFSYRGINVTVGTFINSMVGVAATAIEAIRALERQGLKVGDDDIEYAISQTKFIGRGEVISFRPMVVCCGCYPADLARVSTVVNDFEILLGNNTKRLDMLVTPEVLEVEHFGIILDKLVSDGYLPGRIVVVCQNGEQVGACPVPAGFTSAGGKYVISDTLGKGVEELPALRDDLPGEEHIVIILGKRSFAAEASREILRFLSNGFGWN